MKTAQENITYVSCNDLYLPVITTPFVAWLQQMAGDICVDLNS